VNRKGQWINRVGTPIKDPPVRTKTEEKADVLTAEDTGTLEDSYVYVHCYYDCPQEGMLIRIWKTTFLIDRSSGTKSGLVHAENISIAPQWTVIPAKSTFHFLLIFSGLPRSCQKFDFVEEIQQPGGFRVNNIMRNEQDVYHVTIV